MLKLVLITNSMTPLMMN